VKVSRAISIFPHIHSNTHMATQSRLIRTSPGDDPAVDIHTNDEDNDNDDNESNNEELLRLQSPVPLSREEAQNAEIRKLAAKLAPVFEETDAFFAVPAEFQRQGSLDMGGVSNDDDDDMDSELQGLEVKEDLLRQELELAEGFSALFGRYSSSPGQQQQQQEQQVQVPVPVERESAPGTPQRKLSQRLSQEADWNDPEEDIPERIAGLPPIRIPDSPAGNGTGTTLSTPRKKNDVLLASSPPGTPSPYTNQDHFKELRMQREERGGWYSIDLTNLVSSSAYGSEQRSHPDADAIVGMKEYVLTIPETKLKHLFVGLPEPERKTSSTVGGSDTKISTTTTTTTTTPAPLPVRTVSIRIRPDVLCGAVMDAVHNALTGLQAKVGKRQGGHIRAVVSGAVVSPAESTNTAGSTGFDYDTSSDGESGVLSTRDPTGNVNAGAGAVLTRYPPFLVDVQLCTHKSSECERMLLIRIYHNDDDGSEADLTEDLVTLQPEPGAAVSASSPTSPPSPRSGTGSPAGDEYLLVSHNNSTISKESVDSTAALHLRECSALVQRIESPAIAKRFRPSHQSPANASASFSSQHSVKEVVAEHLLESYRACPSAKEGNITLPGLNSDDWPVVLASWRFLQAVWDELETRDLTYTTLAVSRFGAFPALPTLDVHYCSQIRRLSREAMIVQLLKSASELEEYAREAEFACANMIALLRPTFETYEIDAPSLPKPVALTAYPLNFTVPQASCPPWGVKVMEALNKVQASSGDASQGEPELQLSVMQSADSQKSFDMAHSAVELVLKAFQKQDDEEQSARLGRKNMQVMDRLAKMQAHQRGSIQTIQNSIRLSHKAAKAAADFRAKAGVREVPLLKWSIVVGKSTGTCWVTANHVFFVTQLIPYIGGSKTTLLRIEDIDFELRETPPSVLNPLPTVITIKQNGQEVYSFRPSMGGARLKSFLGIVKGVAMDDPIDMPDQTEAATLDYGEFPTV
jgi:hypothetical protein